MPIALALGSCQSSVSSPWIWNDLLFCLTTTMGGGGEMVLPTCWMSALRNLPCLPLPLRVLPCGSQPQCFKTHAERTTRKRTEIYHQQFKFSSWLMYKWPPCEPATGKSGLSAAPRNYWCSLYYPEQENHPPVPSQHQLMNENSWSVLLGDVKFRVSQMERAGDVTVLKVEKVSFPHDRQRMDDHQVMQSSLTSFILSF